MINLIKEFYYGKRPFWQAFWLLGFIGLNIFVFILCLFFLLLFKIFNAQSNIHAMNLAIFVCMLPIIYLALISIYRCRINSKYQVLAAIGTGWAIISAIGNIIKLLK